jgi:hypothetical protein
VDCDPSEKKYDPQNQGQEDARGLYQWWWIDG